MGMPLRYLLAAQGALPVFHRIVDSMCKMPSGQQGARGNVRQLFP